MGKIQSTKHLADFASWYNKAMTGVPLTFNIESNAGTDVMGNPILSITQKTIDNCLIAPVTTPANAREQLALEQGKVLIEIHIPKGNTDDISNSTVIYQNKVFKVDTDHVSYLEHLTPTQWSRRLTGELITL